jgi:phosphate transport system substrate-binding protein
MRALHRSGAALLGLLLAACGSGGEHTVIVTGASTIAPLMNEIARRFESEHPGVRVDVQTGGSSRGIADARQGISQIGMVSRGAKDDERDLQWFLIARDGLGIIVHRDNSVPGLSSEQIRAIYRDQVQRWSELGGPDAPIHVVHKAEGRSTLELFLQFFALEPQQIVPDEVIGDNLQGIKSVAGNPDAIGYVSVGSAEYEASHGTAIRLLGPDGEEASTARIQNGTYTLLRALHLVTRGEPQGDARELIEFARSPAVRGLIEEQYFVPVEG